MEKFPVISELSEKQRNRMGYLLDKCAYRGYYVARSVVMGEMEQYHNIPINKVFESFNVSANEATEWSKEVMEDSSLDLKKSSEELNVYPFGNLDLKTEFNRLGFDYPYELTESASAASGDKLSELHYMSDQTYVNKEVFPNVQALTVNFEVRNFMNGKRAHIEALTVSLYKKDHAGTPTVRIRYSESNGDLPKKEEIFHEMIEALKTQILETEFSKLDFDYSKVQEYGLFNLNDYKYQMLLFEKKDFSSFSINADGLTVIFTISQEDNKAPFIESLSAAIYKEIEIKDQGSVEKSYSIKDGPLPKKADVYNDLVGIIRAQKIWDIFKINADDSSNKTQAKQRNNRR